MTTAPATPPAISVILPVHNVADLVGPCVASLRAQTFSDFEVIAVEDGSTDASPARLAEAIGDDPRFRVIAQPNAGLSAARNTGLAAARGAFIAFVDSDDRVAPGFLARLHGALAASPAPWAACAIRFCHPDGTEHVHSAIHGAPEPGAAAQLFPLDDWREAIRHFPSAWNKLYRRELIGETRFTEGLYYEDHAFFQRLAARAGSLLHLPEPLYLQTRERPGQITGEDSERVFEQFTVLEECAGLLRDGPPAPPAQDAPAKHHAAEAFARLAGRLTFERSTALRDPERRARFARAARDFLDRHGLEYQTGWDRDLSPLWGREMAGDLPLSVVIPWNGQAGALETTLTALAAPPMMGMELLVSCDPAHPAATPEAARDIAARTPGLPPLTAARAPGPGPGPARNAGLAAARGRYVAFLDAGDRPLPHALMRGCDAMERAEAGFAAAPFYMGRGEGRALHGGFHDMAAAPVPDPDRAAPLTPDQALALHAMPSAKLFRRDVLERTGLRFGAGPLDSWQMTLGAALLAGPALLLPWPGVEISEAPDDRRLWHAPVPAGALARTVAALPRTLPPEAARRLPPGWQARLLTRALWEKLEFAGLDGAARTRFRLGAAWALLTCPRPPAGTPADPYIPRTRLTRLAGLRHSD